MKSETSLSDKLSRLFLSSEDNLIAIEIIKFMKKDPKEGHSDGYIGPKRNDMISYVQNILKEKHEGYHAAEIIDSVITQLESYNIIHSHELKKKEENKHYQLDKAYREIN